MKNVMLMLLLGAWLGAADPGQAQTAVPPRISPRTDARTTQARMATAESSVDPRSGVVSATPGGEIQLAEVETPPTAPPAPRAKSRTTMAALPPVTDAPLQSGILEEELNVDLNAAIQSYQALVTQFDGQRATVANAIFRLGECYRRLGKTNEASLQYARILREFADQPVLARLARKQLGESAASGTADGATHSPKDRNTTAEAQAEKIESLKKLRQDSPDLFNHPDTLREAINTNQIEVVRFLVDHQAEVNAFYKDGNETPLLLAVKRNSIPMVELLLAHGANPNLGGIRPLCYAAQRGNRALAEVMLKAKAEVNGTGADGYTALHHAVLSGNKAIADLLRQNGCDLNAPTQKLLVLSTVLRGEASRDSRGFEAVAPIHIAVLKDRLVLLEWLCTNQADLNLKEGAGNTPLYLALSLGNQEAARLLLKYGADFSIPNQNGRTIIMLAIDRDGVELAELLLSKGLDPNRPYGRDDGRAAYPLCQAAGRGKIRVLETLLKHQADPKVADNKALFVAIQNQATQAVARLLAAGAPANGPRQFKDRAFSPLHFAVLNGTAPAVNALLGAKAAVDLPLANGATPLHLAAARGDPEMVATLLDFKANPNAVDQSGNAPLSVAWLAKEGYEVVSIETPRVADFEIPSGAGPEPPGFPATIEPGGVYFGAPTLAPDMAVPVTHASRQTAQRNSPYDEIIRLLLQHGAREDADRACHIYFQYGTNRAQRVFTRDARQANRFTLLELAFFADGAYGAAYPDWTQVRIHRFPSLSQAKAEERIDLLALVDDPEAKDVALAWGDVVEIPEKTHQIKDPRLHFSTETMRALIARKTRKVTLNLGAKPSSLELASPIDGWPGVGKLPSVAGRKYQELEHQTSSFMDPNPWAAVLKIKPMPASVSMPTSFWLGQVLRMSRLALNTSDLTRIKVLRAGGPNGETKELVLDLKETSYPNDLWLEDGDVVTIPDKGK